MADVSEVIVSAGHIADAAGKVIDFAGKLMPQKTIKTPATPQPAEPPKYDVCELKTLTVYVDENRVDLNFSCRRQNDDGSLAPAQPVVLSTSSSGLAKLVTAGNDALTMLQVVTPLKAIT